MVFCCRQVKIRILEFLAVQKLRGAACAIGFEVGFNLCRFIVWKSGFMWIYGFTILWYWVYGGYTYTYTYIHTDIYIYIDKQIIYIYIYIISTFWMMLQDLATKWLWVNFSFPGLGRWNGTPMKTAEHEVKHLMKQTGWVRWTADKLRGCLEIGSIRATNSGSALNKHIFW